MRTSTPVGPVTADDVDLAVDALIDALTPVLQQDWHVLADDSDWDCWEVVEHICDDLFAYAGQLAPKRPPLDTHVPIAYQSRRVGGPPATIFADPKAGQAGLLQVLDATRAFLTALVRTSSPDVRAHHVFGVSDPEGFAAMGVVEVLAHGHDVALALGLDWAPPADLCARVLRRLFPDVPEGGDPWATLLWATGRGTLPGRARLNRWRWDGRPRS
ncbi:maleylpyruvate isomerase N-terminal domain-containing protein [Kitasatospora mediocidica]|uniref:maleylpyruvate isomerase N-terminal domain-containing protein n=1 Tax=Kitasatospora mediocidica TaxID=58352 RepID=UPI00056410FD|nr:maleylpyruvate isomerase N-terminal domain-containing protein [Kitasatospora mediocidica]